MLFLSGFCEGVRDGKIPCFQKEIDDLDDQNLLCMFLLLRLEFGLFGLLVKIGLSSGARES